MLQSISTPDDDGYLPGQSIDMTVLVDFMRRIASQEKSAFREFYYATSSRLFGVIYAILRDQALAEDVLQEIYIRIWQRAGDYREELGTPIAWITTMARHRAIDEIRKRTKLISSGDVPNFDDIPAESIEPLTERLEHENSQLLVNCLERLERSKKEMIVFAYKYGLSREKLAEQFNTPVATVKTWLRRGLSDLRNCMGAADV